MFVFVVSTLIEIQVAYKTTKIRNLKNKVFANFRNLKKI